MKKFTIFTLVLISLFLLAACTGTQSPAAESDEMMSETMTDDTMTDEMMADNSQDMAEDTAMADEDMMAEGDEMMDDSHDDMDGSDEMMDETMGDMDDNHDDMDESMGDMDETMGDMDETMGDMDDAPVWQNIELTDARTGETFTLASFSGKTVFVEPMATWCTNCRQQLGNVREARAQFGDDVVFIGLSLETNLDSADLAQYQSDQGFDWTFAVMTPEMLQSLADTFGRSITVAPNTPHFVIRPDGSYTDLVTGIDSPDELVQFIQGANS